MPLHKIYHGAGLFSDEDKKALSDQITKIYTNPERANLPAFYVVVLFIPIEKKDYFVGGKSTDKFVRISIQHIARHFESYEQGNNFIGIYEAALTPYIKDRGLDWELQVEQVDRNLWRENGISPPLSKTDAEKEWVRLNKPVLY